MKRGYFFSFITLLFCSALCFTIYGKNRRRSKTRSKSNNVTTTIAQNQNVAAPNERGIKKRGRRRAKKQNDNPDEQQTKPAEEPVKSQKENEIPEAAIPRELKEIDQRKPAQENAAEEKKSNQIEEEETIEFYFENTDLQGVVTQIAQLYDVTFITDDIITPIAAGRKALKGNKISFKTHRPLTKKEGWNLFLTFLDIAGFAIVPDADPTMFRITTIDRAKRAAIPSYIGVEPSTLPDSDQMIRYVYFIENINPETLKSIVDQILSSSAGPSFALRELKALIVTDKAYNIKMLMKIVKELDKVSMPQAMSVLKLRRADAEEVKKLYEAITKTEEQTVMARLFPARRQPTSLYFPENIRIIAEPRNNALILLGPRDAIEKIEDFVLKHIDVESDKPYSPLHTYQLRYSDANTVAKIMNDVTKFGAETAAGKVGGVRGGDKYFKPMLFIPESSTNQLIIRGDYEDYLKALDVIKELDEPQPQVAIEILILTVEVIHNKELGAQIRSKENGINGVLGQNVEFQTGNFGPIQTRQEVGTQGCQRLLGNLLNLVKGLALSDGNTVVSLGCDAFGVWGILKVLETISNSEVISNPFLLTTNKTKANVSVGEVRRLKTATIKGTTDTDTYGDESAKLNVTITPQINSDGMIVLDIIVDIIQFLEGSTQDTAARSVRNITTKTTVADNEVIALGGLIRNVIVDNTSKTPLFGDIPLLGWLFKNKRKEESKGNLLILVSTKIIKPGAEGDLKRFTNKHIDDYYGTLDQMYAIGQKKDPIHKLFFEEPRDDVARQVEDLLFEDRKKKRSRKRMGVKKKEQQKEQQKSTKSVVTANQHMPINKYSQFEKKPQKGLYTQVLAKQNERKKFSLTDLVDDRGESVL